jgi:hypothetical protein
MSTPFVLAVPSKGRLQENAEAFFTRAGLALAKPRGAREYRGTIMGLDNVEIAYLSASEIASQLAAPTSWSPCRRPGSTSAPWPISTTSPPASASNITGGCGSRPNTST